MGIDSLVALLMFLFHYVIKPARLINDTGRWWYRLNARYRMSTLFREFFAPDARVAIAIPSISLKPSSEECHIVAYKTGGFGDIPGRVNTTKPFVRHTDALAAGAVRNLLSPWLPQLSQTLDDEMTPADRHENIVCIGGQTNSIFCRYFHDHKTTGSLQYYLNPGPGDHFEVTDKNLICSSNDKEYAYGVICSRRNNENPNRRILFLVGLGHRETIATAKRFSDDMVTIFKEVKKHRLLRSNFYCIVKFRRTPRPADPLAFHSYVVGRVV